MERPPIEKWSRTAGHTTRDLAALRLEDVVSYALELESKLGRANMEIRLQKPPGHNFVIDKHWLESHGLYYSAFLKWAARELEPAPIGQEWG